MKRKIGPFPLWLWIALVGAGVLVVRARARSAAAAGTHPAAMGGPTGLTQPYAPTSAFTGTATGMLAGPLDPATGDPLGVEVPHGRLQQELEAAAAVLSLGQLSHPAPAPAPPPKRRRRGAH